MSDIDIPATGDVLSDNVLAFCTLLRTEYGFRIGHAEAYDALRAAEAAGIHDVERVRTALRLVCCGSERDVAAFDRAFDAFFLAAQAGVAQPAYHPRHTRPGREPERRGEQQRAPRRAASSDDDGGEGGGKAVERRAVDDAPENAESWNVLRARYSPAASASAAPEISFEQFADMLRAAGRIVDTVRRGRSRRWKPQHDGTRFDVRRTFRASLQTGGDPIHWRTLGHPLRNPRFVLLADGSRSMSEHTTAIVQFARALVRRTSRAHVFFFSTELHDVTRKLRAVYGPDDTLGDVGEAWGGGTKIGASLHAFVRDHGRRLLTRETVVIVFSDGLDAGDIPQLERALHAIDQRSAGIVWLNPHAAEPGFQATARGMRAALPFITLLSAANDAPAFTAMARDLSRAPRLHGRRR